MTENDNFKIFGIMFSFFMIVLLILQACGINVVDNNSKSSNYTSPSYNNSSEQQVYDRIKGLGASDESAERSTKIIKEMTERDRQIRMGSYSK